MSAEIVVFPGTPKADRRLRLVEQLEKTPESKSRVQQMTDWAKAHFAAAAQAEELAYEKKKIVVLLGIHIRQMVRLGGAEWTEHEVAAALAEMRRMQF